MEEHEETVNIQQPAVQKDDETAVEEQKETPSIDLGVKIVELEEKAAQNWDKALRALSDLENYRKRAEREISNAHRYALEQFLSALLPVLDSLEQALGSGKGPGEAQLVEGVRLTYDMFVGILTKFQVQQVDPQGELFDPNLHEAMSTQADSQVAPGTVLAVLQKGYLLNSRVIRPARVVVSKQGDELPTT